jgi:hypothetical protein
LKAESQVTIWTLADLVSILILSGGSCEDSAPLSLSY